MENKPTKKFFNYNYISVVLLYIWAFVFLIVTPQIKGDGARLFPYIVCILTFVLATVLLIKSYLKQDEKKEDFDFSGTSSAFYMAIILLGYIIATTVLGFYLATPFYLYIAMWVLGQRKKKLMAIISLLTPLGVFMVFDYILGMRIPEGILLPWLL